MTYDEILNSILTDIKNQQPDADISIGSMNMLLATRLASALWGLYKLLAAKSKNIFPDTADTAALEHHGVIRKITRLPAESDAELLVRVLADCQTPPAAGTEDDYVRWAKEVDGIASAVCIPAALGAGTVDITVLAKASAGSETPSGDMLASVQEHIDSVRPVTVKSARVLAAQIVPQNVTMTVSGIANPDTVQVAVTDYMAALKIGETLTRARLINIAMEKGATDVQISEPAVNISVTQYQVIRPATVTVS